MKLREKFAKLFMNGKNEMLIFNDFSIYLLVEEFFYILMLPISKMF